MPMPMPMPMPVPSERALASRSQDFACTNCGAVTMYIPEWADDDAFIECAGCGKPFVTIRELRERLEAALDQEEEQEEENGQL